MKNDALEAIIGNSNQIKHIKEMILQSSRHTHVPVLISGETGTGKELVANALHKCSNRLRNEIIRINCSTIHAELLESTLFGYKKGAFTGASEESIGLVEAAKDGTLFLDEISEMDLKLQPKLLRFLENGSFRRLGEVKERIVEVWVLAATNRDLAKEVESGHFRKDLYYRLKGMEIIIPPLRERLDDVKLLIDYFIFCNSQTFRNNSTLILDQDVLNILQSYSWPGNVRELKQLVQQLSILAREGIVKPGDLTLHDNSFKRIRNKKSDENKTLKQIEYEYICQVLKSNDYQIRKTAQILGVDRNTLRRKMKEYSILTEI